MPISVHRIFDPSRAPNLCLIRSIRSIRCMPVHVHRIFDPSRAPNLCLIRSIRSIRCMPVHVHRIFDLSRAPNRSESHDAFHSIPRHTGGLIRRR
jgi:hypothetical protein